MERITFCNSAAATAASLGISTDPTSRSIQKTTKTPRSFSDGWSPTVQTAESIARYSADTTQRQSDSSSAKDGLQSATWPQGGSSSAKRVSRSTPKARDLYDAIRKARSPVED